MIDVNGLFPKLSEVYTEEGVNDAHVMAGIIEKICKELPEKDIRFFMHFINGRSRETHIMIDHIYRDHIDHENTCKNDHNDHVTTT